MQDLAGRLAEAGLGPDERMAFLEACRPAEPAELTARLPEIDGHLARIRHAADSDPTVDADTADWAAGSLAALLESADGLAYEERRLLMGAVEYFVSPRDAADDLNHLQGIDDDARVVRAVCLMLGRPDLVRG